MGRLVRVGSYYIPSRPQTGEVATFNPFRICYRKYPGISPWSQWMTTDI